MIIIEELVLIDKENLQEVARDLHKEDLPLLVGWLSEKDDKIRYQAFLLLENRSEVGNEVYPFWDIFAKKLINENSYQRSIGLMLIAANAKWDEENRLNKILDNYLGCLKDEKPITVRQCIQSLEKIISFKPDLNHRIAESLMELNMEEIRETMRKSILMDILNILLKINKLQSNPKIDNYISFALTGNLLDKKAKRQIEACL